MHIAANKRKLFYDVETSLFNASMILGECILESRINQIIAALDFAREILSPEDITIAGFNSAGALALFTAFFDGRHNAKDHV